MIDYSKWKKDIEKVSNLLLDHKNPRFSHTKESLSQNELINEMVRNYKIYDLARSIANDGYFPDKNLIVVKEEGKLFVLEGNRRIAALKSLLHPDIISGKEKEKFTILSAQIDETYVKAIPIVMTPSRIAANPIIFKEHTGNTAMPWSRIMQAEFYVRQLNDGFTIDQLANEYHRSKSDINKFLKLHYMYNIARNFNYENKEIEEKVQDKQNFPASVLERVYDSATMRDFLGITFDSNGGVKGDSDKEEFEKVFKRIVNDIVLEKEDTRTLNSEDNFKRYAKNLIPFKPKKKGRFTHEDFIKRDVTEPIPEPAGPPIKKGIKKSAAIIPSGLPFRLKNASNLHKNYLELRKLPVKSYPNTTAVMLRTFLDKTLRIFLKRHGIKEILGKQKGEEIKIKLPDASLGELIDYISSKEVNLIEDDNVKKTLRKFKSSGDASNSLSALNSVTHNEEFSLTEPEIRDIWPNLEGLFIILLAGPKND